MPLEGKLVILREEQPEDMKALVALRNDLDTQAWSKSLPPDYTEAMYHKRFNAREFSVNRSDARFVIVHKETKEVIGFTIYSDVEPRWAATLGMAIAKKFWGGGFALDAQDVVLRFLFVELGVRVVRMWTHSGNPRMVGLAAKSGFQASGRQRQSIFRNGELYDNLILDLLREEYFARHPELTDNLPPLS